MDATLRKVIHRPAISLNPIKPDCLLCLFAYPVHSHRFSYTPHHPISTHTPTTHSTPPPMISTAAASRGSMASKRASVQLVKSFNGLSTHTVGLRPTFVVVSHFQPTASRRNFSSSPNKTKKQEVFLEHDTPQIKKTPAAWPHPGTAKPHPI
jgi:hypothetical protein